MKEAAAHLSAIAPFFQFVTLLVFCLTAEWVLSLMFVVPRHFLSRGGSQAG